ncbi:MAG TPA: hypothetical protein PKL77_07455 [Candidatus Omnitrophota bacterium]|nr:hypothetical protein [Candidatus Omnitrophota bacterium]
MSKEKILFRAKLYRLLVEHPWLKLVSLVLAILVWFYVKGEINKFNF